MDITELYQYFKACTGISTDTRNILPGNLFFALKGPNFDGNTYAVKALDQGATYAIVDSWESAEKVPGILQVPDVLKVLQALASHHRKVLKTPLIAITGSNGKTTTKELFKEVLQTRFTVLATQGNLNNHIGVPLTLLKLKPETDVGIIEMGANHKGEIKALCAIATPDWGYITNFGKAHLEGFGSLEGVIEGKSELYHYLKASNGKIIINGDDPIQLKLNPEAATISFGKKNTCNHPFEEITTPKNEILLKNNETLYSSSLYGKYNIPNIAAAITIGEIFNVPKTLIQKGIQQYKPENNRSQIVTKEDISIVLDAYNANPTSVKAALNSFLEGEENDKKVILGDMLELGAFSKREHQKIVQMCSESNLTEIFIVGKHFCDTLSEDSRVTKFKTTLDLINHLKRHPIRCDKVLIKGSRGMALEKIIPFL